MSDIAVVGKDEFLLGFRLAGIRNTFSTEENAMDTVEKVRDMETIGVMVIDDNTMSELPEHFQDRLNNSVRPVVVRLSTEAEGSELRDKIIRAIGVDLWEGDNQ